MKEICVITGGGSGIGLATAACLPQSQVLVISGRTQSKLEKAAMDLSSKGYEVHIHTADTSDRGSIQNLALFATSLGSVKTVINAAGLSPSMADPEQILRVNALGTLYVNQEFSSVMKDGGVIVDVSSNSAYFLPDLLIFRRLFRKAEKNESRFLKRALFISNLLPKDYLKSGLAYAISKRFAIWYSQKSAFELGGKHIRVVSASPGLVETGMGKMESGKSGYMLNTAAEHRMGKPEEIGFALASIAAPRNAYLAGVDVLIDGGSFNGRKFARNNTIIKKQ